jgi:hypothetical protein
MTARRPSYAALSGRIRGVCCASISQGAPVKTSWSTLAGMSGSALLTATNSRCSIRCKRAAAKTAHSSSWSTGIIPDGRTTIRPWCRSPHQGLILQLAAVRPDRRMPRGCPSQDRHSKCREESPLLRGETADGGERFRQAKRDRLHVRRRAGHCGHANSRDRTSMATPPCNRLAAGQRQRESAERSPTVEARWWRWRCSTPAVSSASERKAEAHRPPYLRDGISTVNPRSAQQQLRSRFLGFPWAERTRCPHMSRPCRRAITTYAGWTAGGTVS